MPFEIYGRSWPAYGEAENCIWCGIPFRDIGPFIRTKEHILPHSEAGRKSRKYITAAHHICNNHRGTSKNWVPYSPNTDHRKYPPNQAEILRVIDLIY